MEYGNDFLMETAGETVTVPAYTIDIHNGEAHYLPERLHLEQGIIREKEPFKGKPDLYVSAGFINCHMHWMMNGDTTPFDTMLEDIASNPARKAEIAIAHAQETLKMGITFGWDKGPPGVCALPAYTHMREAEKKGVAMTRFIQSPWAIMHEGCFGFPFGRVVGSEKEVEILLLEAKASGSKAIKCIPESALIADENDFRCVMPEALFRKARLRAAEHGLLFAVHAKGNDLLDRCISARVDCIEHGIQATDRQLKGFQDNNIYLGPTLHGLECRLATAQELGRGIDLALYEWETACEMVKSASSLNDDAPFTHMLFASDAGSFSTPHASLRELYLLRKQGYSPTAIFEAATVNGALCTRQETMGSVETKKAANLIYWNVNPLELPVEAWNHLEEYIAAVVLEGALVYPK